MDGDLYAAGNKWDDKEETEVAGEGWVKSLWDDSI